MENKRQSRTLKATDAKKKPTSEQQNKIDQIQQALAWLKTTFPETFASKKEAIKPLKIKIDRDIFAYLDALPEKPFTRLKIRQALRYYTLNPHYRRAVTIEGNSRIDLKGEPAGTVTKEHVILAKHGHQHRHKAPSTSESN